MPAPLWSLSRVLLTITLTIIGLTAFGMAVPPIILGIFAIATAVVLIAGY